MFTPNQQSPQVEQLRLVMSSIITAITERQIAAAYETVALMTVAKKFDAYLKTLFPAMAASPADAYVDIDPLPSPQVAYAAAASSVSSASSIPPAEQQGDWYYYAGNVERPYYYNPVSKESRWDAPLEWVDDSIVSPKLVLEIAQPEPLVSAGLQAAAVLPLPLPLASSVAAPFVHNAFLPQLVQQITSLFETWFTRPAYHLPLLLPKAINLLEQLENVEGVFPSDEKRMARSLQSRFSTIRGEPTDFAQLALENFFELDQILKRLITSFKHLLEHNNVQYHFSWAGRREGFADTLEALAKLEAARAETDGSGLEWIKQVKSNPLQAGISPPKYFQRPNNLEPSVTVAHSVVIKAIWKGEIMAAYYTAFLRRDVAPLIPRIAPELLVPRNPAPQLAPDVRLTLNARQWTRVFDVSDDAVKRGFN